jgi:hypothetical protein
MTPSPAASGPASTPPREIFTDEARAMVAALADLIVPCDGDGPGARDARVAPRLEQRVGTSAQARARYSRGLAAIDRVARRHRGRPFLALPPEAQRDVLARVDRVARRVAWTRDASLARRAGRRLALLHYSGPGWRARHGMDEAKIFFPQLVDDVLSMFWTSSAAWRWIGYDGPPMAEGYPELAQPRGA